MKKFVRLIVALLVVFSGTAASRAVQIDPSFAGLINVRQIDNGIFGTNASNATQLAFGPGPDSNLSYLYMSSTSAVCGARYTIRLPA